MKRAALGFIFIALMFGGCSGKGGSAARRYTADWSSLMQKEIPQWVVDAKFGIYAHWGIYSIGIGPAWTEKHLYNPAAWAELVKKSGARFAGFSIAHHDGFGLWDSDVYKWNVGRMGPKRDLYGEFVRELRKRGIKIYATSHMYRTFNWMNPPKKYLEQAKREHWDLLDPKYKDFYWSEIRDVDLLGSEAPIEWERTHAGLVLHLPEELPNDKALVFRVTLPK